jgi:hypothetical protein
VVFKSTVSFKDQIKMKLNAVATSSFLPVAIQFSMKSPSELPLTFSHSSSNGSATVLSIGYYFVWMWFDTLLDSTFFCEDQVCSVVLFGVMGENFTVSLAGSQLQAQPPRHPKTYGISSKHKSH